MINQPRSFKSIPVVIKNLLIINVLFFAITYLVHRQNNIDLTNYLGLHYFSSGLFRPYQFVTYMFMHDQNGPFHIFFNMFALFMFGNILEQVWGPKRFLIFYMITGIGAAVLYMGYQAFEYHQVHVAVQELIKSHSPEQYVSLIKDHFPDKYDENQAYIANFVNDWTKNINDPGNLNKAVTDINQLLTAQQNSPMIGASGAIFGILIAFAMLFPNTELFLMFIPIPIKAKYAIVLYAAAELFFGVARFSGDNIAHFAHLGGALVGFIMVKIWQKRRNTFY